MSSLITRQPAFSSVNRRLNEKPSLVKKSIDRPRSFTGRLTKIFVDMGRLISLAPDCYPLPVPVGAGPKRSVRRAVGGLGLGYLGGLGLGHLGGFGLRPYHGHRNDDGGDDERGA